MMTRLAVAAVLVGGSLAYAQEPAAEPAAAPSATTSPPAVEATAPVEPQRVVFAQGRLAMTVPGEWKQVEPRNRIIECEFAIAPAPAEPAADDAQPAATPDILPEPGRMTVTLSGGTIEDNMQRWLGQFRLGHDADGQDAFKRDKTTVGDLTVHRADIAGTYFDAPQGPFGPKVERSDYRLLGAMIETPEMGTWYLKFYGPQDLIEQQAEAFDAIVQSLEVITPTAE